MDHRDEEMTPLERDVLLAWSGELGFRRRAALETRLRADPEARRLAETLALVDTAMPPRARSPWVRRGKLAACLVAVVISVGVYFETQDVDGAEVDPPWLGGLEGPVEPGLHDEADGLLRRVISETVPLVPDLPLPMEHATPEVQEDVEVPLPLWSTTYSLERALLFS